MQAWKSMTTTMFAEQMALLACLVTSCSRKPNQSPNHTSWSSFASSTWSLCHGVNTCVLDLSVGAQPLGKGQVFWRSTPADSRCAEKRKTNLLQLHFFRHAFTPPFPPCSLSNLGWHFGMLFQSFQAYLKSEKLAKSVLPRFSEKRGAHFELWALKELPKNIMWDWLYPEPCCVCFSKKTLALLVHSLSAPTWNSQAVVLTCYHV